MVSNHDNNDGHHGSDECCCCRDVITTYPDSPEVVRKAEFVSVHQTAHGLA